MLAAVSDVLKKLGFNDFTIQLNHRQLLTATLNRAGLEPGFTRPHLSLSTSSTKLGVDGVLEEMVSRNVPQRRRQGRSRQRWLGRVRIIYRTTKAQRAAENLGEIMNLCASTAAVRPCEIRTVSCARPLVLHRRNHGGHRPRSGRQPRRRWPLRRIDWHVSRRRRARVRVLARASSASSS